MPICQFCGRDEKLIGAHIIPEAFFRRLRDGQDPPRMLTSKKSEYPKRMPIGEFDPEMLCDDCKRQFSEWDGYAQELLGKEPKESSPIVVDGETVAYEIKEYNWAPKSVFRRSSSCRS